MNRHRLCLIVAIPFTLISAYALAGKLEDFEREATEDTGREHDSGDPEVDDEPDSEDGLAGLVVDVAGLFVLARGVESWQRVRPPAAGVEGTTVQPRRSGEALIPFVRVDAGYQAVESDVDAIDARLEVGFGPFAVQGRGTHYREDDPDDELDLMQAHALYRMSFGSKVEVDLGVGAMVLSGDDTRHGISGTVPILIHPWEVVGLEFRPAWAGLGGHTVGDYDLALVVGWRYLRLRSGYRWLSSGPASLNGPTIGLSARW